MNRRPGWPAPGGLEHSLDLDAFVTEHAGEWRRLEQLSRRRRLTAAEADEILSLYQRAGTHLAMVRSRSPEPVLVARLSRIVLAARGAITGGPAFSWRVVGRFFTQTFPLAVFLAWRWWVSVAVTFTGAALLLMRYVAAHRDVQTLFLSSGAIRQLVNSGFAGYYTEYQAQNFALQVWTNNAYLTAQCLAAGVLILPVLYVLAGNLLNLGVVGGIMIGNGHAGEFFGLITPHGLLELTAVYVAAGAGLRIGWAWIAPGPGRTRGRALAQTARSAMLVALGLVVVLAVSGAIEAFVTPSPLPTVLRIGIGVLAWLTFLGYVFTLGPRAARARRTADLDLGLSGAPVPTA